MVKWASPQKQNCVIILTDLGSEAIGAVQSRAGGGGGVEGHCTNGNSNSGNPRENRTH